MKTQQPRTPWNDLTLNVALWLERDVTSYEAWHSAAEEVLKLSRMPQEQIEDPATELALRIRRSIRELVPNDAADVIVRIIYAALFDVDWLGIARALIADITGEEDQADNEETPQLGLDSDWEKSLGWTIAWTPDVKFSLGHVVTTEGVSWTIDARDIREALSRHQRGDWGNCCIEDRERNDQALHDGSSLMSIYRSATGDSFWIITASDRSVTTVLLPCEY
jgi:ABC-type transport system substrate-binding protein